MKTPAPLARSATFTWQVLLVGFGVLLALYVFRMLTVLTLPIIIALFVTTILMGPVKSLAGRGVPRLLAVWIVFLGSIALVVGVVTLMAPEVSEQFQALGPTLDEGYEEIQEWLRTGPLGLSASDLENYTQQALDAVGDSSSAIATSALSAGVLAIEVLAGIVLSFVLTFFFLKDGDKMCAWFVGLLREEHRDLARTLGARAWTAGGGYVRGTAIVALVDAVLIGIGLYFIGVPLLLPLALLTFIGGFFPLVGATAAGFIAILVALVDGGLTPALFTLAVVVGVQQVEGDLLQPLVMARTVKLHPVAVLGALTAGAIVSGLLGAFLAVPAAAVTVAIFAELRARDIVGPGRPRLREEVVPDAERVEPAIDPGQPDGFRSDGKDQSGDTGEDDGDPSAPVGSGSTDG